MKLNFLFFFSFLIVSTNATSSFNVNLTTKFDLSGQFLHHKLSTLFWNKWNSTAFVLTNACVNQLKQVQTSLNQNELWANQCELKNQNLQCSTF